MTQAVHDGDVPMMLALRAVLGWRTIAWWRSLASWRMAWDPYTVQMWKHKIGFHSRIVQWDTPMARWAGEGNDWKKLMVQRKPRRENVIQSLLESMKQTVGKKTEPDRLRNQGTCAPLNLEYRRPESVRGLYLATEQYSSLCVSAVVSTLGGDDIEDGVPDREQIDCEREEVEVREKQERDKNEKTTTHAQTCDIMDGM